MPSLDAVSFLTPGALGAAIEVTVASIASPTELNSRAAAQGDIILARTTEAGTGTQTWYYADTTSGAESLPYIVSSATAGVKFIAFGGRYQNENVNTAALTASRLLRTDASKNLESNAALTNTRVTFADSSGWPTDSANFTFTTTVCTIANTTSASSATVGAFVVGNGTAATSVALGGGNINCGGTLTTGNRLFVSYNSAQGDVGNGVGDVALNINGAAGSTRDVQFKSAGVVRWLFRCNNTAESGSDAGSNFVLNARADGAGSIDEPLTIIRAAGGNITLARPVVGTSSIRSTSPTAGVGYATGAGGTVTQGSGSGKATTVTLNTVCGTITMDGATLNADTTVAFTFTNSAIAATDLVVMQHSSVGTLGAYNFAVTPGAGTATVSVRNVTPGNLSEAIVIRFAIIKAVTS